MDLPAPPGPLRTPGTVVTLRILAWIQVGGLGLLVVLGVGLAGFSTLGLQDEDELTQGFATLGVLAGVLFAGFGVLLIAAVMVPTLLLRTGRRSRRTGALTTLAVVEGVFVLVQLLWVLSGLTSRSPADAVFPLLLAAVPVAVLVLALHPASRAWAATHPDEVHGWGPPPGWSGGTTPPVWNAQPPAAWNGQPPATWGGQPPAFPAASPYPGGSSPEHPAERPVEPPPWARPD